MGTRQTPQGTGPTGRSSALVRRARRVGKAVGRRADWKKATVKLREGDRIEEIFEGFEG